MFRSFALLRHRVITRAENSGEHLIPTQEYRTYTSAMLEPLSFRIRKLLTVDMPFAYCDSCLALRFRESLADTRAAAMLVAREDGFMRKVRVCYGCKRAVEMTEVRR